MLIARNFNLNLPDFDVNRKVHSFLNLNYQNGIIQTFNKSNKGRRKALKSIEYNLRNYFIIIVFKTELAKTDIFDHFPICYLSENTLTQKNQDINIFIYRRTYNTSLFHTNIRKIKDKDLKSSGISTDIKRYSKLNQLFHEKFFKRFKLAKQT